MSDILAMLLPGGVPPFVPFPPTSRYAATELRTGEVGGQEVRYLARRLVPPPEAFAPIGEHVVVEGERPDTVAARYLGDPEQWWRLADANAVLRPGELTATIGRRLRITLAEGIPGTPSA